MRPYLNLTDEELELIHKNFILCKDNKPAHDLIYKIGNYLNQIKKYNKDKEELIKLKEELDRTYERYVDIGKELNRKEEEFTKKY